MKKKHSQQNIDPQMTHSTLMELPEKLKVAFINILKDFRWGNICKEMEILKWTFLELGSIISKIKKSLA